MAIPLTTTGWPSLFCDEGRRGGLGGGEGAWQMGLEFDCSVPDVSVLGTVLGNGKGGRKGKEKGKEGVVYCSYCWDENRGTNK